MPADMKIKNMRYPLFPTTPTIHAPPRLGSLKGFPSVLFSSTHITQLSKPFQWALVGKLSQGYNKENPNLGRPPVEELQKSFVALDLKSDFQLGLLDNRHVLIQLRHHEDYLRLYSRPVWYVKGLPMRIFKWTSSSPYRSSSSCPTRNLLGFC